MGENWSTALETATDGVGEVMEMITGSTLLMCLTFAFLFIRKSASVLKRVIRIGGKS